MAKGLGQGIFGVTPHAKPRAVIITRHKVRKIRDRGGHVHLCFGHRHQDARGQGFSR